MPSTLNRQHIISLASQMIGRGAPTVRDDLGFDGSGYATAKRVFKSSPEHITGEDVLLLAKALTRHPRQLAELGTTPDAVQAFIQTHDALSGETVGLSVAPDGGFTLSFRYNPALIDSLKGIGLRWNGQTRAWGGPAHLAQRAAQALESQGLPLTGEQLARLTAAPTARPAPQVTPPAPAKPQAAAPAPTDTPSSDTTVVLVNNDLRLNFRYNAEWVAAVKATGDARWNSTERFWSIPSHRAGDLAENAEKVGWTSLIEALKALDLDLTPRSQRVKTGPDLSHIVDTLRVKYPTARQHQLEGSAFMIHGQSVVMADDMGLGKTYEAIMAADVQSKGGRVIIICPATLRVNWMREITGWLGERAGLVQVILGGKEDGVYEGVGDGHIGNTFNRVSKGKGVPSDDARWLIVNYDLLKNLHEPLVAWSATAKVALVDEAHYLKNDVARTHYALGKPGKKGVTGVLENVPIRHAITGTPYTRRNYDLFNLMRLIRHPLASDRMKFLRRYCDFKMEYGRITFDGSTNSDELMDEIGASMIQRMKDHVAKDLKGKERQRIYVDIDMAAYRRAWDEFLEKYEAEGKELAKEAEAIVKLSVMRHAAAKGKLPMVLDRVAEMVARGEKVIVFTNYTSVADAISEVYGQQAVKFVGGMTTMSRDRNIQRFQNETHEQCAVAVCNFKAAGVGITLTAASYVLMADMCFVPTDHMQAEDRAYRIGQTKRVLVQYLIASETLEEVVMNRVDERAAMVEKLGKIAYDNAQDWQETVRLIIEDHERRFGKPKARARKGAAA